MEHDSRTATDVLLEAEDAGYDPFADFEIDEEDLDDSGGQQGPLADTQAPRYAPKADDRPAPERIEDLFATLAPRRRVLLGILEFLDAPRRSDALRERVEQLQECDFSVYSGYNYSLLLEGAGAVRKVNEDGSDFDEDAEQLPDVVEMDGSRFYKPTDGKQVFWLATEEGLAYLRSDDPYGRLAALVADEAAYRPIYRRVLEFCGSETGRSVKELEGIVDDDPLVQSPRKYCSYFVKKLEDCGALVWTKAWHTTDLGAKGLASLFEADEQGGE